MPIITTQVFIQALKQPICKTLVAIEEPTILCLLFRGLVLFLKILKDYLDLLLLVEMRLITCLLIKDLRRMETIHIELRLQVNLQRTSLLARSMMIMKCYLESNRHLIC